MKYFLTSFFSLCLAVSIFAGTGTIAGKIIDAKTGETMIGVAVLVKGTTLGAATDLDGNYIIESVPEGNQTLVLSYVAYSTKEVDGINVKAGEVATVDVSMAEASNMIEMVVIKASRKTESISTVLVLQKNSITVSDGISGAAIRNSPDKNTSEVIRRVSGVTIQDNKFPIVRGLNDRYNLALVNGTSLPSTEPDKKAFSFDLFPSNLIDNIIVNKAATPDLPADFAGGIIQLTTKDIPDENYISAQLSTGINTQSTGNTFLAPTAQGGSDWLGIDDGTRALPAGLPSAKVFSGTTERDQLATFSRLLPNDWAINNNQTAAPNAAAQVSAGYSKRMENKSVLGAVVALTYNRNQRITESTRRYPDANRELNFDYQDTRYTTSYLNGALANLSYKINDNNKISLKNTFNINTEENIVSRRGMDIRNQEIVFDNVTRYRSNKLFSTQLTGEHVKAENGLRVKWIGGYSNIDRDVPNQRQMLYRVPFSSAEAGDTTKIAAVPNGGASPFVAGKFFSQLNEKIYTGTTEVSYPFKAGKVEIVGKGGVFYAGRTRDFSARVLGLRQASSQAFPLLTLPQDSIFRLENINRNAFLYSDITNPEDAYTSSTDNTAGFVMGDIKFTEKLRVTVGARYESYQVKLDAQANTGAIKVDTTFNNLLPSLNMTYALTEKSNLRFCASQTLSRPELRELAPFSFYDLELNASRRGNPALKQTDVYNFDARYEIFPEGGELFSISAFYKRFINPIEEVINVPSGFFDISYTNAPSANNFGAELEFRKKLSFIGKGFWDDITVFSNLSYIKSEVNFVNDSLSSTRPLQGQSPYIVNVGMTYSGAENGWSSTILFNQVGRRISQVGTTDFPTVYEAPRPLLDFQLSKKFGNADIRFNISDILNRRLNFYQDVNGNGKFDKGSAQKEDISVQRFGTNMGLSFNYKF